jgi:hypothetical protein
MTASDTDPPPRPLITPVGLLLLVVFVTALVGVALSTQPVIKRIDAPPPGTILAISGKENTLFIKLAEKSIKGLHHAIGVRGRLGIPNETVPRPMLVRSLNSADWDTKIKTPQFGPSAKPGTIESHIVLLLAATLPDDMHLYGQTIAATFDVDMIVPRLDPANPKVGQCVPLRVTRSMQLQIQPPGFRRIYQRLNFISLLVASGAAVLALLRQYFRRKRHAT